MPLPVLLNQEAPNNSGRQFEGIRQGRSLKRQIAKSHAREISLLNRSSPLRSTTSFFLALPFSLAFFWIWEVPGAACAMRRIAASPNTVGPVVICEAADAELRATTSCTPVASHMVTPAIFLDRMSTVRASLDTFAFEILKQANLIRPPSVLLVLLAGALGVPSAAMVSASPLRAMMAAQEAIIASIGSVQIVNNLATATTWACAPSERALFLQVLAKKELVKLLEDCFGCFPLDIMVVQLSRATLVGTADNCAVPFATDLEVYSFRNALRANVSRMFALVCNLSWKLSFGFGLTTDCTV